MKIMSGPVWYSYTNTTVCLSKPGKWFFEVYIIETIKLSINFLFYLKNVIVVINSAFRYEEHLPILEIPVKPYMIY